MQLLRICHGHWVSWYQQHRKALLKPLMLLLEGKTAYSMYTCIYIYIHTNLHIYIYTNIFAYVRICIHTRIHMIYIYIFYIYMYKYIHVYIYT